MIIKGSQDWMVSQLNYNCTSNYNGLLRTYKHLVSLKLKCILCHSSNNSNNNNNSIR